MGLAGNGLGRRLVRMSDGAETSPIGPRGDGSGPAHDAGPREYAARLAAAVAAVIGRDLAAAYLHGSAALGGWVATRSDFDVLFVVADDVTDAAVAAIANVLAQAGECPGRGLEYSVVTGSQAARPAPPWPFVLHAGFGHGGPGLVTGRSMSGDPDLLMHYAVIRSAGIVLAGPPPEAVIGPVSRTVILAYLADELAWGLANAPECYAVLNACRARVFLDDDRIVSKVAGGLVALRRGSGPPALIKRALDQQLARVAERRPGPDAAAFASQVAAALKDAAAGGRAGPPC
jgi:aminoglycoside adenylyltransferase-like protein